MSLSKIPPPSIIEQVYEEVLQKVKSIRETGADTINAIEQIFVEYSKNKTIPDTNRFATMSLQRYFKDNLEMTPTRMGLQFVIYKLDTEPKNKYIFELSRQSIPKEYYAREVHLGPEMNNFDTSLGEVEECYITSWLDRAEPLFKFDKSQYASKRINFDKVVKVLFETREIIKRVFDLDTDHHKQLKLKMADQLYLKVNTIHIFLLKEMNEMMERCPDTEHASKRKKALEYHNFLLIACIMYQTLLPQLSAYRLIHKEDMMMVYAPDEGDLFAHSVPGGVSLTNSRVLTTSATPSSSNSVVVNDVRQFIN